MFGVRSTQTLVKIYNSSKTSIYASVFQPLSVPGALLNKLNQSSQTLKNNPNFSLNLIFWGAFDESSGSTCGLRSSGWVTLALSELKILILKLN